jgi:four helix bundle protein
MRRAAVSIPSNIVEGSARRSPREYLNFLNIARGSAAELTYLIKLARDAELVTERAFLDLMPIADRVAAELAVMVHQLEQRFKDAIDERARPIA